MPQNKAWTVASFPTGALTESNFKLVESSTAAPKDGEVLVRNLWLSLDPYMRGRLSQAKSYVKGVEIGDVMTGETAGEVVESKHPKFKPGDKVITSGGMLGVVVNVKEKSATIRSADSKVEVTKGAITEIVERGGDANAS